MIINFKYNFILLRVPKNASTSLASFFVNNLCSKDDIYTRINDNRTPDVNVPPSLIAKYKKDYRFIHLTLNELIDNQLITAEKARSMKVITVIRNPMDRQLSLFFWKNRHGTPEQFQKQFANGYHNTDLSNKITQYQYGCINDQHIAECWLYENLDYHVKQFLKEIDRQDISVNLPKHKSNITRNDNQYWNDQTRSSIVKYFNDDIQLYNRLHDEYISRFNN